MEPARKTAIESLLKSAGESNPKLVGSQRCSGGCIHNAELIELSDGRRFFIKSSPVADGRRAGGMRAAGMFVQESHGLAVLAAASVLRVPKVVAAGMLGDDVACLILEAISPGEKTVNFWEQFGQGFALLHRNSTADSFGWSGDNFIGSNRQLNDPTHDWVEFFREQRLRYQFRLAKQSGHGSREFYRLGDTLLNRLGELIYAPEEPPSLLHGDLWSGNYLVDECGMPVLIDPASYYGRREADLAMPLLFGGFPAVFFDAYHEAWPLESGWRERVEIYKLYHLLNHLNLFGSGYLDSCLEVLRRFA